MTQSGSPVRTAIRRRDRTIGDEGWIRWFLGCAPVAVLGASGEDGPVLNSNLFVYDRDADRIYLHTAHLGSLRDAVEHDPRVSLHVMEMGRILPAPTAVDFSVEYAGVTVIGRASIVREREEARAALQSLLDKYAPDLRPGRDYQGTTETDLKRTTVYRIDIERWSGKRKTAPADHPRARSYESPSALERENSS